MKMVGGLGQTGQAQGSNAGMQFDPAALQNLMKSFGTSIPTPTTRSNAEKDDSIEIELDDLQTSSGDKTDEEINELLTKLHAAVEKKKKGQ
jgi:hypothetical protein